MKKPFGLLTPEDELARILREHSEEEIRKLFSLCQQYGIAPSPGMFYQLALALAREFVPGFQEKKPRGRKSKWTALNKGALVVEIERLAESGKPSHGVAWAANQLAKREPWKSFLEAKESEVSSPNPAEALRKVYHGFKGNKWAQVMRKAFEWHQHANTVPEWEADVEDFVRKPHPDIFL